MASVALERSWTLMMAGLYLSVIGVCVANGGIIVALAGVETLVAFGEALARLGVALCWIGALLLLPGSFWYRAEHAREHATRRAELLEAITAVTGGRNP